MNYLIDTHYIIWALLESGKISPEVKSVLENPRNNIYVSAVSFWELSIKRSSGKLGIISTTPISLLAICEDIGFKVLHLHVSEASSFDSLLADHHKDPFDRMLIWQAMCNGFTLISDDSQIRKYAASGLKVIW